MPDRWSSLLKYAADAPTYRAAFNRWISHIGKPVNADEYRCGRDVFLLWENEDRKWVVDGASKGVREKPRRIFDTKAQAQASLEANGGRLVRTRSVGEET